MTTTHLIYLRISQFGLAHQCIECLQGTDIEKMVPLLHLQATWYPLVSLVSFETDLNSHKLISQHFVVRLFDLIVAEVRYSQP